MGSMFGFVWFLIYMSMGMQNFSCTLCHRRKRRENHDTRLFTQSYTKEVSHRNKTSGYSDMQPCCIYEQ